MKILPPCMKGDRVSDSQRLMWRAGFHACLDSYSIWNDGVQRIGAQLKDIREIMRQLDEELAEELEATEDER